MRHLVIIPVILLAFNAYAVERPAYEQHVTLNDRPAYIVAQQPAMQPPQDIDSATSWEEIHMLRLPQYVPTPATPGAEQATTPSLEDMN